LRASQLRKERKGGEANRWETRSNQAQYQGSEVNRSNSNGQTFEQPIFRRDYEDHTEIYSQKVRAGKRTYIFDVRATRGNDFYITISERKRRSGGDGFQKQKIFLYKEDFNKFLAGLQHMIAYVKTELLPDYDFDQFDRARANGQADFYDEFDWDQEETE
jgi:hypothetical protein